MRLLYWTEYLWPYIGGIQVMASQTLPALQRRGYEIAAVTCHGAVDLPDDERAGGISVHRFPILQGLAGHDIAGLAAIAGRIADLKRRFKPDLVHLNFTGPSMWLYFETVHVHPAPLVVALRGLPEGDSGPDTLLGHAADAAAWVVAVSRAVLHRARVHLPQILQKSSVIYNAFRAPALRPARLPFAPAHLMCLGRLVEEKRFCLAVEAMQHVLAEFPDTRLTIAGDGPERSNLERLVAQLGLAAATRFLGWVSPDAVPALLNETTLLIMPSRSEGLPGVAIQAAQMGRPVVATRVGGSPEVVVDGETGLIVERENAAALGAAICSLLASPERANRMAGAAYARARHVFDWKRHVDAYDALYRQLVGGAT
jgi:glycogen(starch) synthase